MLHVIHSSQPDENSIGVDDCGYSAGYDDDDDYCVGYDDVVIMIMIDVKLVMMMMIIVWDMMMMMMMIIVWDMMM